MRNLVAGVGVEPTYEAYETSDWAASLTRNKLGPGSWSRTSGRSIIGRVLCHLSFSWMEPADGIEPSSVAYHATARPLSYTGELTNWIPAADLNRALLITKQVRRHLRLQGTHWSLVPESNWLPRDTKPAHRRQCLRGESLGASGGSRTLLARVALWSPTARPHPRTYGAEYGSPTRLTGLEDQSLRRSVNSA